MVCIGPCPVTKLWSCKLVQIALTPNVWPGNVNVSDRPRMPCYRCYLIPLLYALIRHPHSLHWLPITGGCHSAAHDRHVRLIIVRRNTSVCCLKFWASSNLRQCSSSKQHLKPASCWRNEADSIHSSQLSWCFRCSVYCIMHPNTYRQQGWTFWAHGIW